MDIEKRRNELLAILAELDAEIRILSDRISKAREDLANVYTVDDAKRFEVHGRWVDGKCSNCGVDIPTDDAHDAIFENECRFCYYCGAKMDGKE